MEQRESRFCTCGFRVYGLAAERRSSIAQHRQSGEHDKRERNNAILGATAIGWSALADSLKQAEVSKEGSE
jgi:hypothetical protein